MTTHLSVPHRSPVTAAPTRRLPSWQLLCRRLGTLHISPDVLTGLSTFGDLQQHAKGAYRALSKRLHPDVLRSPTHPTPVQGYRFQRITQTYRWLQAFPRTAMLPHARTRPGLRYPTPPMHEMALPFALTRPDWHLPEGFQVLPGGGW
jgi:hypothetical protein